MRRLACSAALAFALACGGDDGPTGPNTASVVLRNQSATHTIDEFYYSTCTDVSWGSDRLTGVISPGQSQTFTIDAGCWDFLVVRDDGFEDEHLGNTLDRGDVLEILLQD